MVAGLDCGARHLVVEGGVISAIGAQSQIAFSQLKFDAGPVLYLIFVFGKTKAPS